MTHSYGDVGHVQVERREYMDGLTCPYYLFGKIAEIDQWDDFYALVSGNLLNWLQARWR